MNIESNDERYNSYVTKEELIKILTETHFKYVNYAKLELITGFLLIKGETDSDHVIQKLSFSMEIE